MPPITTGTAIQRIFKRANEHILQSGKYFMNGGWKGREEIEVGRGDKDHKIIVISDTVSASKLEQLIGVLVEMLATTLP